MRSGADCPPGLGRYGDFPAGSPALVSRLMITIDAAGLRLRVRPRSGVLWAAVGGEVDLANAAVVSAALITLAPHGGGIVVVDMAAVTFFSRAGAEALLAVRRAVSGRLTLIRVGQPVQRLLHVAGLLSDFVWHRAYPLSPRIDAAVMVPRQRSQVGAGWFDARS